ncbi:MAG: restriction endonuclease subunit S [Wenzhouxiangella sp.]|nr:restriction endonuclease subunit S [Wenzhouxiangella sp.]MCH8477229.1 restriction endonuclease subunit S [Wenzhouxiangella sp.]
MSAVTLKRVQYSTQVTAQQMNPADLGDTEVVHYSIPALQQTGRPAIEPATEIASNKWSLRGGEVLVSKLNVHKNCVAIAERHDDLPLISSTEFVPFVPTDIEPRYLKYVFQSEETIQHLMSFSESATRSHARVNPSDIVKLKVHQPDLSIQESIANYLDRETARIDGLIAEKERMLALLKEKRAALISRVVTRGLDANAPLKPSGQEWLGEIPAHWELQPIKYLAVVGNGSTPSVENADYWDEEGYPWLNSSVVNVSPVTEATRFVTETALRECHLPKIQPPAVLVGITGQGKTRGMAAVLGIEATINQHVAFIKPRSQELDTEYLRFLLGHSYAFLRSDSDGAGSTKGAITCEQLSNIKIPAPPSSEQVDICTCIRQSLDVSRPLRAEIQRTLELLTERRSALITAAVTGQIPLEEMTG